MIELKVLEKSYGELRAVQALDLSVKNGELFGFLGPNGAGKTTTIKMMVGLLRPDRGQVLLNGIDMQRHPLAAKAIMGYVPDEPVLYEKMTGLRYLRFMADIFELPGPERAAIEELAESFQLKEALSEVIAAYSHGMKQKLSIIAALLHSPEVFILDEPIVGLDPRSAFVLKEKMKTLCRQGRTVFFSTHVMEVAERLCDRVGIISQGRMIAVGPLAELRDKAGSKDATLEKLFLELTDATADPH